MAQFFTESWWLYKYTSSFRKGHLVIVTWKKKKKNSLCPLVLDHTNRIFLAHLRFQEAEQITEKLQKFFNFHSFIIHFFFFLSTFLLQLAESKKWYLELQENQEKWVLLQDNGAVFQPSECCYINSFSSINGRVAIVVTTTSSSTTDASVLSSWNYGCSYVLGFLSVRCCC